MSDAQIIRYLTPTERANIKQLAQGATHGPWRADHGGVVTDNEAQDYVVKPYECYPAGKDDKYIAAVSPDLVLGTLAYIEMIEEELRELRAYKAKREANDKEAAGYHGR
jgi:hypothetical protein